MVLSARDMGQRWRRFWWTPWRGAAGTWWVEGCRQTSLCTRQLGPTVEKLSWTYQLWLLLLWSLEQHLSPFLTWDFQPIVGQETGSSGSPGLVPK